MVNGGLMITRRKKVLANGLRVVIASNRLIHDAMAETIRTASS